MEFVVPTLAVTLWMPSVEADNSSSWPTITSATLQVGGPRDVVKFRDRNGAAAGDLQLPPGDGEDLLRRLGLHEQLTQAPAIT